MGDTYMLHPQMLAHMREQSAEILRRKPWLAGPYAVPEPPKPVVEPVPAEPVAELTPGQRAEALLRDVLAIDPVPANTVQETAQARGIALRTLRRARERMKVQVFKRGRGRDAWHWALAEWEEIKVSGGNFEKE
jgi:hypothetical protein